jgi:predicted TIM-barrel fold metal-dependent hydrolase
MPGRAHRRAPARRSRIAAEDHAMAQPAPLLIDSDTHITEPPDLWTSRVPARWKHRVPRVEWDEQTREQWWVIDGEKFNPVGMSSLAGWPEKFPGHPRSYQEAHPAAYDARARLRYMDEIGCWAAVLYPNIGGFGNQKFLDFKDPELMLACVRAYNDFQIEWISPDPRRFVPIMATPFWDVPAAVTEIERCARLGFKGILFCASPQDFGQPFIGDRHWEPLWSAAQDAGLPISLHIGSGGFTDGFTPERIAVDGTATTYARTSSDLFLHNGIQLADLLLSGVLPRHPSLRFVSVESGIGWIPFLLEAVDHSFRAADVRSEHPEFELLPSEYFRRQVYACYWFEKIAPRHLLDYIGVDNILFETDFPHPTCLYGNVAETIEAGLGQEPEAVRRRILLENAAELYRVELP